MNWLLLRDIGNSGFSKTTMLIPVLGWLIVSSDGLEFIISYFNETAGVGFKTYFPLNIYLMYFGLLFLGIASIIYNVACPQEIKGFPESNAYISYHMQYPDFESLKGMVLKEGGMKQAVEEGDMLYDMLSADPNYKINNSAAVNILRKNFELKNKSLQIACFGSAFFYLFGILFSIAPTIRTMIEVFEKINERIF